MSYAEAARREAGVRDIAGDGCSLSGVRRLQKAAQRDDYKLEGLNTPYGTVVKRINVPGTQRASTVLVRYICPFAFLWYACSLSPEFFGFLATNLCIASVVAAPGAASLASAEAAPGVKPLARIALYHDGITPGNINRHDKGRAYVAVYWTFLDFPAWFRATEFGWFSALHIPETILGTIAGGASKLMEIVLSMFWGGAGTHDMALTGMRVRCGKAEPAPPSEDAPVGGEVAPAEEFSFKASFACFIADEKAVKELAMCKGASGTKMCIMCQNLVRTRRPLPPGSRLVDFRCSDWARICTHTHTPQTPYGACRTICASGQIDPKLRASTIHPTAC